MQRLGVIPLEVAVQRSKSERRLFPSAGHVVSPPGIPAKSTVY